MLNIISKKLVSGNKIIAEIFADEMSEISGLNSLEGYELFQGSTVYVIKSGELLVMGGDGLRYSPSGEVQS